MSGRAYLGLWVLLALAGCPQASSSSKAEVLKRDGKPDVHTVDNADERMRAAIQTARETVQADFIARLEGQAGPDSPRMMFKSKFEHEGEAEHMWISSPRIENGQLVGTLDNTPTLPLGLKRGDEVRCDPAQISDWMIVEEGKLIGGYTLRAIRDGMTDAERMEFDASVSFSFD